MQDAPRPELLAPAGDPEAFAAAIEAGADAVYLGLQRLSARARARNFSGAELDRAIAIAHARGRRVYVTLNTVVLQAELRAALRLVAESAARGADAAIVQDLGLARAIAQEVPEIELHASTQLCAHNLEGARSLAALGARRVILARELRLDEVERIVEESPIGIEIFIHGALCFCVSGACLFSSFLGGFSGNRGWCTQPCRRAYEALGREGHFFSMADLSSIEAIGRIRRMPLAGLKIEGRMKSADYVGRVVRVYRTLLDVPDERLPDAIAEAKESLRGIRVRSYTPGFLGGAASDSLTRPHIPGYTGRFIGKIERAEPAGAAAGAKRGGGGRGGAGRGRRTGRGPVRRTGGTARRPANEAAARAHPARGPRRFAAAVRLREPIATGERLRVQFPDDETGESFRLGAIRIGGRTVRQAPAGARAVIEVPFACARGDLLFRVEHGGASGAWEKLSAPPVRSETIARRAGRRADALLARLRDEIERPATIPLAERDHLTVHVASFAGHRGVPRAVDRLLVRLGRRTLHEVGDPGAFHDSVRARLAFSLPAVIFPGEVPDLRAGIARLLALGFLDYEIDNVGHIAIIEDAAREAGVPIGQGGVRFTAGPALYAHNRLALEALARRGSERSVFPLEGDARTLDRLLASGPPIPIEVVLFAYPALFTTRVELPFKGGTAIDDARDERFIIHRADGVTCVHSHRPMSLLGRRDVLREKGIRHFRLDLTGTRERAGGLARLIDMYREGRDATTGKPFNFDLGLR
ncbi:MAG: U32 family peptidase [Planctomycetes bacterium]|nr:U32 family peptidase [Planctomycetota bacterium]